MKSKDVLAILDGTISSTGEKGAKKPPVLLTSDEIVSNVQLLGALTPATARHSRPLKMDPLQAPPVF